MSLAIAGYFPNLPPIPFLGQPWTPAPKRAPKVRRAYRSLVRDWRGVHGNLLVYGESPCLDGRRKGRYLEFECLLCHRRGEIRIDNLVARGEGLADGCRRCASIRAGLRRRAKKGIPLATPPKPTRSETLAELRATNLERRSAR